MILPGVSFPLQPPSGYVNLPTNVSTLRAQGTVPPQAEAPLPKAAPGSDEKPGLPRLEIMAAADFGDDEPPPRRWHVHRLIPAGEITLLTGDGGNGKSLLALQLAFATATGGDWIATIPEPGRVLFLSAEDDRDELHRRLYNIARRKGRRLSDAADLDVLTLAGRDAVLALPGPKGDMLAPTLLFQALRAKIAETRPALIVLDTLADLFGGDEIKRAHARQFIGLLRGFAVDFGATVVLLAHPSLAGMSSGTGTSGSTAWSNSVRSRLYLEKMGKEDEDNDGRVLKTMKANYGRVGEERVLRWQDGVFVPNFEASGSTLVNDAVDEQVFLACLSEFDRTGRKASPNRSKSYAPTLFAETPTARSTSAKRLSAAMERLFAKQSIHVRTEGPPTKRVERLMAGPAPSSTEGAGT